MSYRVVALLSILGGLAATPFSHADVLIDNFNASRSYPACCGEYGAYLSFESNLTQNGTSGTVRIEGTASDNGGFYRDLGGEVFWDFTLQTNLLLRAKSLPGNTASNCWVIFRDIFNRSVAFSFALSNFSTNSFITVTNAIGTPAWIDESGFSYAYITALDVHGGMTDDDLPFQLEIDELKTVGPSLISGPSIAWSLTTNTLILSWTTPTNLSVNLESTVALGTGWSTVTNVQTTGTFSQAIQPITGTNKFFRLSGSDGSSLVFDGKNEKAFEGTDRGLRESPSWENPSSSGLSSFRAKVAPPTNSYFGSNFIDTSLHFHELEDYIFAAVAGQPPADISGDHERRRTNTRNSHDGGTATETQVMYRSHSPIPGYPYWQRTATCVLTNVSNSVWTNNNGGYGTSIFTGCNGFFDNETNNLGPQIFRRIHATDVRFTYGNVSPNTAITNYAKRTDDNHLHLHTEYTPNTISNFILLSAKASNIVGMADAVDYQFATNFVNATNISVLGKALNADGKTFKQVLRNSTYDATPVVNGSTNYGFDVQIVGHAKVTLTRTYHPLFDFPPIITPIPLLAALQSHFDKGSEIFGRDDDDKIPDADVTSSTNATSVYRTDDSPAYVQFFLTNGPVITNVLTRRLSPVFPGQFRSGRFYRLVNNADVTSLLGWTGSNIKLVKSLRWNNASADGIANQPSSPATMILIHTLPGVAGPHEWCHTLGIDHRNAGNNYGPTTNAVMNPVNFAGGVKINRYERGFFP